MAIILKTPAEIEKMRTSGRIQAEILNTVGKAVQAGVSTAELNAIAEEFCQKYKVKPAFKGYSGFPAALCTSINDEVVHGIPSPNKILKDGDIITIDFGCIFDGWYSDACQTFLIGKVSEAARLLVERVKKSLYQGIAKARAGNHVGDISHAIESYVKQFGYSPVRETVGHGIGRHLHEDPEVPNWGEAGTGAKLEPGMTICIEPIINAGTAEIITEKDGWTTRTTDGKLCAHFEHMVLITEDEAEILTPWDKINVQ